MTIAQFKASKGTENLHVKKNPNTDKLFMTDDAGNILGAVSSSSLDNPENLTVSEVTGTEGTPFYLLHPQGEGVEDELTL